MLAEKIGAAAMLEQTAEECIELAHACMKLARETRGENPTFKDHLLLVENIHEEMADVLLCIEELMPDEKMLRIWKETKINRIKKRFQERD